MPRKKTAAQLDREVAAALAAGPPVTIGVHVDTDEETGEEDQVTRYLKITLVDGTRFILRVTHELPRLISGVEVNAEGDEIVPRGVDAAGRPYHQRVRHVQRDLVRKAVEMRMNPRYATLEVVPREELAKKTLAHAEIRGASEGAVTENACRITRSKLYPTPGRSYRFAWKWLYTVAIPGEPYTFDGDTLGWVRSLCKRKAPGLPIVYAWKEREASAQKKTAARLDAEIAEARGRQGSR